MPNVGFEPGSVKMAYKVFVTWVNLVCYFQFNQLQSLKKCFQFILKNELEASYLIGRTKWH